MKKNLYKALSLFLAVSFLTSCLKDDSLVLDPAKGTNVIEFKNPAQISSGSGAVYPLYSFAYELVPEVTLPLEVGYSGPASGAPEDITVNLAVGDDTQIKAYNDEQETEYTLMPAADYVLTTNSVVIKKGQKTAVVNVKFKPGIFDLSESYVLPLVIKSTSSGVVSGNFGTILINVNPKNAYDGLWEVTGSMVDAANGGITGRYPKEYYLITQTATSAAMFDFVYAGTFGHEITSNGGPSYYGSYSPVFTFDATGNITSVVNYYGQPAGNGRSAKLDESGVNKFTSGSPGTVGAVFKVKYFLLQPGTTVRTSFDETWTYKGARP